MRTNDFRAALKSAFEEAERQNLSEIEIDAGELHRKVGGYPGPHHRMPSCCDAIRAEIRLGDLVVHSPPKGKGASLRVRFKLPRIAGRGHIAPMPTGLSDHPPASYASNRAASSRNAEMDLVARTDRTVADKIRALAAEGYRRADRQPSRKKLPACPQCPGRGPVAPRARRERTVNGYASGRNTADASSRCSFLPHHARSGRHDKIAGDRDAGNGC